ncbi:MFS transporter [Piscinibacter sp.]|uniref:MFS transporter n=1 Tax=Piscinibacter sp. TaxID=1903157 RepID=UPI002C059E56|nr:MFS transporter [Albitalea sp.]HUG25897.1 MFS transporter [Albitalea sp.]
MTAASLPGLRTSIVVMSAFAVVSDAVLIAFYPQFFAQRYGMTSAFHVGAYIAAISIAVMFTLPLWARVAKRVETMSLLLYTQCAAGMLCAASYWADSVIAYWVLTMAMFMCKSSYLLMYPYLMRLEKPEDHAHTIGLLSVVVYLGGIFGAVAGGWVLQAAGPAACLWLMAAGDFAQMFVCAWLIRSGRAVKVLSGSDAEPAPAAQKPWWSVATRRVLQLSLVVAVFDFAAYLIRPFFSVYWEQVSPSSLPVQTGLVFAIPGTVALAALVIGKRSRRRFDHVIANLLLGAVGLLLQAAPSEPAILAGRVLYGWALFQLIVKFEVILFRLSTPEAYARDFSVFNFFQNLGVLLSSFAAGALVGRFGAGITFVVAAGGLLLTAALDRLLLRPDRAPAADPAPLDPLGATPHAN